MTKVFIVALNTFRQTLRQKLFLNVGIFGVGMLLLSMVMGNITFGYADRVVRSIGLSGVSIALSLMALLVSVSLIHQEIDKKTLFVVLTRPIKRWQYLLGRYAGLLMALVLALIGFVFVFVGTLIAVRGTPTPADFIALAATLPEAAIVAGFGIILSSFSTPTLSAGLGLGFWIASTTTDDLLRLTQKADAGTQSIAKAVYYVLPNLERFNFRNFAVYQEPINPVDFASCVLYGAAYAVALVAIASAILGRREMV